MNSKREDAILFAMLGILDAYNYYFLNLINNKKGHYILENSLKKYAGKNAYKAFIQKQKNIADSLSKGTESLDYYANILMPEEPTVYPMTVREAQERKDEFLLDIITLELHYVLNLVSSIAINGVYKDLGYEVFPFYIEMLMRTGWSEDGAKKAYEYGLKRIEYYHTMSQISPTFFSRSASNLILGIQDDTAQEYTLQIFTYCIQLVQEHIQ